MRLRSRRYPQNSSGGAAALVLAPRSYRQQTSPHRKPNHSTIPCLSPLTAHPVESILELSRQVPARAAAVHSMRRFALPSRLNSSAGATADNGHTPALRSAKPVEHVLSVARSLSPCQRGQRRPPQCNSPTQNSSGRPSAYTFITIHRTPGTPGGKRSSVSVNPPGMSSK